MLQLSELFPLFDKLHAIHGSKDHFPIYGAGQISKPKICLVFMNPTAKNVSSFAKWTGLRAPWLGTKNVWRLLNKLGFFNDEELLKSIMAIKPEDWTLGFAEQVYTSLANQSIYITNIAKCTQEDARHLSDTIYKEYRPSLLKELEIIKPEYIFTLGNQVSSVLLGKPISVSNYLKNEFEILKLNDGSEVKVYPAYYPIGQGTRNMNKAIGRIKKVLQF